MSVLTYYCNICGHIWEDDRNDGQCPYCQSFEVEPAEPLLSALADLEEPELRQDLKDAIDRALGVPDERIIREFKQERIWQEQQRKGRDHARRS